MLGSEEPMNCRYDLLRAGGCTADGSSVAHVALHDLDPIPTKVRAPIGVAREDADGHPSSL